MARRFNASQLRSKLRQIEQKQRQAVNKINQAIRRHNSEVRAHNARVRSNRARLAVAIARLNQPRPVVRYTVLQSSAFRVREAYSRIEQRANFVQLGEDREFLLDLSEREAANSLDVYDILETDAPVQDHLQDELGNITLTDELHSVTPELHARWQGAIYALNLRNPDAARHFCTSSREILIEVLDHFAPNADVLGADPDCPKAQDGLPTRRSKVNHLLVRRGITDQDFAEFAEQDIENVLDLFHEFNRGTHGEAGTYTLEQLKLIRKRVEDAVFFLLQLGSRFPSHAT